MDDRRRALRHLSSSFGLSWVAIALIAAPGPAAWVALSGDAADAGVFFATYSISAALGAALAGRLMDRLGRRPVLAGAHLLSASGFVGAGTAYAFGALLPFALSTVALAVGFGAIALTRLAAGEMFPPAARAKAVGRVQVSATFGAVAGPLLLVLAVPLSSLVGRPADTLVWFLAPPALLVGAALVLRSPEPHAFLAVERPPTGAGGAPAAAARPIHKGPLLAGVVSLLAAACAMVAVMGVAGVALRHDGHGTGVAGLVMAAHFIGMFGLSIHVGRIADRFGRRRTLLAGLGVLGVGGACVSLVPGAFGLGLGLLLIGLGWSFAYIGGTVIVTDVVPAARRARVMGLIDFATAGLSALAAFVGGWWYAGEGLFGLGLAAIALAALPLVLASPLKERSPGEYGAAAPARG